MRISLSGVLRNAIRSIPKVEDDYNGDDCDCTASCLITNDIQMLSGGTAYTLEEIIKHIKMLKEDPKLLDEFLELYCLPSIAEYEKAKAEQCPN